MTKLSSKQEVIGTRTGYVIRFTCPSCLHDNAIINKTPKECYRETRDATCHQCRIRSTVLTPDMYEKKVYPSLPGREERQSSRSIIKIP